MTWKTTLIFFTLLVGCSKPAPKVKKVPSFYESELFHEVQMQQIFEDSKTFVDCTPKEPLDQIILEYEERKNDKDFQLTEFVSTYFSLPNRPDTLFKGNHQYSMLEHIENLWPILTRTPDQQEKNGSLIALPFPYVVPGGRFSEVYYWDSYFTMIGLMQTGREEMVKNMLDNFAFLIDTIGHIPNGNRSYYISRSQPPFFALMVDLYAQGKDSILLDYLPKMEKEYAFWMEGMALDTFQHRRVVKIADFIVNRYWDDDPSPRPESYREDVDLASEFDSSVGESKRLFYRNIRAACESGWDFSSRWLVDSDQLITIETTSIIPVDLNCLLYQMELLLARAYDVKGEKENAIFMKEEAVKRKAFINKYCWDPQSGYYYDFHYSNLQVTGRKTLAGMFPLWLKIASPAQAAKVKDMIQNHFLSPGGVITTLTQSGQQWDAPNGWAPLQWVTVEGVKNYGYDSLAHEIVTRWYSTIQDVYSHTGKMMEKYNVLDTTLTVGGGEYPAQDGFGWTNGVAIDFKKQLEEKQPTE